MLGAWFFVLFNFLKWTIILGSTDARVFLHCRAYLVIHVKQWMIKILLHIFDQTVSKIISYFITSFLSLSDHYGTKIKRDLYEKFDCLSRNLHQAHQTYELCYFIEEYLYLTRWCCQPNFLLYRSSTNGVLIYRIASNWSVICHFSKHNNLIIPSV